MDVQMVNKLTNLIDLMDVNLKYFIKLKQFYKDGELESAFGRFC